MTRRCSVCGRTGHDARRHARPNPSAKPKHYALYVADPRTGWPATPRARYATMAACKAAADRLAARGIRAAAMDQRPAGDARNPVERRFYDDIEGRSGPPGMTHPLRNAPGYDRERAGDNDTARAHERYLRRKARQKRNPDTTQLYDGYAGALARIATAKTPKGQRYWEKVSANRGDELEKPEPWEPFITIHRGDRLIRVPNRYGLEGRDQYDKREDVRVRELRKVDRRNRQLDERDEAERDLDRHERSHKRKLGYDPAHAKMLRERRKRELTVSVTASPRKKAAAAARAMATGRTLVERRVGGSSIASQDAFMRRAKNR